MKTKIAVHWQYGAATHSGWQRTLNDDRSLLRMGLTSRGIPYAAAALADGMGGLADGGLAGDEAIDGLRSWLEEELPDLLESKDRWGLLEASIQRRFESIHCSISERALSQGMKQGTTLTVLLLFDSVYWIFHIGDCRVYKLSGRGGRQTRLARLTRDHTWVGRQVRLGLMAADTAGKHPKRNVLLRYLGMRGRARIDVRCGLYERQCLFLLTSDGLHGPLADGGVSRLIGENGGRVEDVQALCDALLSRTLEGTAPDNASVLALRPTDPGKAGLRRFGARLSIIVHRIRHPRLPWWLSG
ncbi:MULTISPECIES: PP2C family serine/threonine-protein phosphatase [unclassified Paenibacillus]|uniref:PP2C family protein-serine/threonine phosphatase n=1 Tax=unclassified Paenibacillus TaxID=185978 RepID=UPI00115F8A74|nr:MULTISPECIES: PP2C family serine/threonine-protein phosphatase [unclassified Paenibacillus]